MSRENRRKPRSGFLVEEGKQGGEPFRFEYLMHFPPAERRSLELLAKLLYFKENLLDEYFPVFKGSHNLAHLQAASLDLLSVARSLASVAAHLEGELSERERAASRLADRYAVKVASLATEIQTAMEGIVALRRNGRRREEGG